MKVFSASENQSCNIELVYEKYAIIYSYVAWYMTHFF